MADTDPAPAQAPSDHQTHGVWDDLLKNRVREGWIDYAKIKAHDRTKLAQYLHTLAAVERADYARWDRQAKLAYWINAYNAFTVKLVVDNHPLASIRTLELAKQDPFSQAFIRLPGMSEEPYSLNGIEHEVLRKEFKEARIHFAIVCASRSCPALRSEAFVGSRLEAQLEAATRAFLRDTSKNRVDGSTLRLSAIFQWFKADFDRDAGSVDGFVRRYLELDHDRKYDIRYLDYDWSLNGS